MPARVNLRHPPATGPEGGYSRFAGRDASRSYVTGRCANPKVDQLASLAASSLGPRIAKVVGVADVIPHQRAPR
jgi:hypothetical protein